MSWCIFSTPIIRRPFTPGWRRCFPIAGSGRPSSAGFRPGSRLNNRRECGILKNTGAAAVALPRAVTCLIVNVITYICIGFCGFRGAKKSGNRGILNGALYGLCYTAVLFLTSCLARGGISFDSGSAVAAAICIGCGAAGGILGVNTTSKKRRR